MTGDSQGERDPDAIGRLLTRYEKGDRAAVDELIPLIYGELRAIASRHRRKWRGGDTLGTTALVHEAYVKLAHGLDGKYLSRSHLLAVASRAMRQILIDAVRSKRALKRGGGAEPVPLEQVLDVLQAFPELSEPDEDVILSLNESLQRLEAESERHCRIVECRFFGGMTIDETAEALDVSPATVKRGWAVAQAWLLRDLGGEAF